MAHFSTQDSRKVFEFSCEAVDRELQLERLSVPSDQAQARPLTVKAGHSSPIMFVDVVWLWRKAQALCEGWWAAAGSAWRQRENHHLRCCEVLKKLHSPNPWHFELCSFRVLQVIWPRKSAKKERKGYVLADNPMSIYCIVLACCSHK